MTEKQRFVQFEEAEKFSQQVSLFLKGTIGTDELESFRGALNEGLKSDEMVDRFILAEGQKLVISSFEHSISDEDFAVLVEMLKKSSDLREFQQTYLRYNRVTRDARIRFLTQEDKAVWEQKNAEVGRIQTELVAEVEDKKRVEETDMEMVEFAPDEQQIIDFFDGKLLEHEVVVFNKRLESDLKFAQKFEAYKQTIEVFESLHPAELEQDVEDGLTPDEQYILDFMNFRLTAEGLSEFESRLKNDVTFATLFMVYEGMMHDYRKSKVMFWEIQHHGFKEFWYNWHTKQTQQNR